MWDGSFSVENVHGLGVLTGECVLWIDSKGCHGLVLGHDLPI